MKNDLRQCWLLERGDLTLEEFVAYQRASRRQQRAQRRLMQHLTPLMQQASLETLQQQLAGLQNAPFGMYRGISTDVLGNLLGGLFY